MEYGQKAGRRLGRRNHVTPLALFSKKRKALTRYGRPDKRKTYLRGELWGRYDSKEIQSMIVSSLVEANASKLPKIGSEPTQSSRVQAREKTSQEVHAHGEGTAVGGSSGGYRSRMHICWRLSSPATWAAATPP